MSFQHVYLNAKPHRIVSYCKECGRMIAMGTSKDMLAIAESSHRCISVPARSMVDTRAVEESERLAARLPRAKGGS